MAKRFDIFGFHKAAQKIVNDQIPDPTKQEKSEYYYLTKLGNDDICFDEQYVKIMKVSVTYTVIGYYISANNPEKTHEVVYSSTLNIDPNEGYYISKSISYDKVPVKYLAHVNDYLSKKSLTSKDIENFVIADARPKLVEKAREIHDSVTSESFTKIKVVESKTKKETFCSVEWARFTTYPKGEYIGFGYAYERMSPVYYFEPYKNNKSATTTEHKNDEKVKSKEKSSEKKSVREKKSDSKTEKGSKKGLANLLSCFLFGMIISAAILLLEFCGILIVSKGTVAKTGPGVYSITTENYDNFIVFTAIDPNNEEQRLSSGKKVEYVIWSSNSDMSNYPLFKVVPRSSAFNIFDASEKKSLDSIGEYHPLRLFSNYTVPKYEISDLNIKLKVTYSYEGVEDSVICEVYKDKMISYPESCYVNVNLPESSMISETRKYVTDMKGNTATTTVFKADLDYWSIEILEVSGVAEVKEANE